MLPNPTAVDPIPDAVAVCPSAVDCVALACELVPHSSAPATNSRHGVVTAGARLLTKICARFPFASVVTMLSGPLWAAMLALVVMPGVVYVLLVVPIAT
jgi:hypothetical protein